MRKMVVGLFGMILLLLSSCSSNINTDVNNEIPEANINSEIGHESSSVLPVVEDGVALWRFTPSGDTPVLTIGAVSRIVSTDTWQEA